MSMSLLAHLHMFANLVVKDILTMVQVINITKTVKHAQAILYAQNAHQDIFGPLLMDAY